MNLILLLTAMLVSVAGQVEVLPTQGEPLRGELEGIDAGVLTLRTDAGTQQLPWEKLRAVEFSSAQQPAAGALVALHDGSSFTVPQFASDGEEFTGMLFAEQPIALPTSFLSHVRLQSLTAAQRTQWQAIVASRAGGDALVLIRSPEALETVEGIIVAVNSESVQFEFGGQRIDAPLSKLAGIRFFATDAVRATDALVGVVDDIGGNQWLAASMRSSPASPGALELILVGGAQLEIPMERLARIDFTAGSLQYLTELPPLSATTKPQFEFKEKITGLENLFGAGARKSTSPAASGPDVEFLGTGTVTYRIPSGYQRLRGSVELRPPGNSFTPCTASVRMDNELLWSERLSEPRQLHQLDLRIEPDRRLQLEVTTASKFPVGAVVVWHALRFEK